MTSRRASTRSAGLANASTSERRAGTAKQAGEGAASAHDSAAVQPAAVDSRDVTHRLQAQAKRRPLGTTQQTSPRFEPPETPDTRRLGGSASPCVLSVRALTQTSRPRIPGVSVTNLMTSLITRRLGDQYAFSEHDSADDSPRAWHRRVTRASPGPKLLKCGPCIPERLKCGPCIPEQDQAGATQHHRATFARGDAEAAQVQPPAADPAALVSLAPPVTGLRRSTVALRQFESTRCSVT